MGAATRAWRWQAWRPYSDPERPPLGFEGAEPPADLCLRRAFRSGPRERCIEVLPCRAFSAWGATARAEERGGPRGANQLLPATEARSGIFVPPTATSPSPPPLSPPTPTPTSSAYAHVNVYAPGGVRPGSKLRHLVLFAHGGAAPEPFWLLRRYACSRRTATSFALASTSTVIRRPTQVAGRSRTRMTSACLRGSAPRQPPLGLETCAQGSRRDHVCADLSVACSSVRRSGLQRW